MIQENHSGTLIAKIAPAAGEITVPVTGQLSAGTNNLWITYNIKGNATEGNKADASISSITTANETYTITSGNPIGSREILLGRKLLLAPGDYGSVSYRIPAITTTKAGTVIAVTDKRKYNSGDLPGDIDIVAQRSTDGGKTWSEPITVALGTGSGKGYGDCALITSNTGKIFALYVGGQGLAGSTPTNPIRSYVSVSSDDGLTWSAPKDITNFIFGAGCADPVRKTWQASFFGSGHALCTRSGRLMVVAAIREVSGGPLNNYVVYSDDEGETWQVSNRAIYGGDEAKVVELNNGDILMSSRTSGNRLWAKSTDGGITWGAKNSWSDVWGNACDADIVRFTSVNNGYDKNRLLHTLPNASDRSNVSMWISYDEGATWPVKKTICPGTSAYSSITILPDNTIGVYLEEDGSNPYKMYFMNFSLNWLSNGNDALGTPAEAVAAPVASIPSGKYFSPQTVTLSTTTVGAKIYYTTDGTTPTINSTLYAAPLLVNNKTLLKMISVKDGVTNPSSVVVYSYLIQADIPQFSPIAGYYKTAQTVTITTATVGAKIYYTLDGTNPTVNSTLYATPITISDNTIIKAISVLDGIGQSDTAIGFFNIGYILPGENRATIDQRYLTSATTTKAVENLTYTASAAPTSYYIRVSTPVIVTNPDSTFTLSLKALTGQADGLQFTQCIILADWNNDYDFADLGERIALIGARSFDNTSTVLNISQAIKVPKTASMERNIRLRVVYTDGWRPTSYTDFGTDPVDKGRMYDFDVKVTPTTGLAKNQLVGVSVYPNPVSNKLIINLPNNSKYDISIMSLNGSLLDKKSVENVSEFIMNFSGYQKNSYIVKVLDEKGAEKSFKLVKQ